MLCVGGSGYNSLMGVGGRCGGLLGLPQGATEAYSASACRGVGASGRSALITRFGLATINKRQFASRGNGTDRWF
jgi:hypothetical protein